mgnify:CR=1 FL=1|uniref:GspL periplasmic domain-containing protein n=1 Tax=Desulfatirhabdium butyrativorans TaxID=340467 RepID=A0A7C4RR78_9BACT
MIGAHPKRIVGLYVGAKRLQYAAVERQRLRRWQPIALSSWPQVSAVAAENPLHVLREFLKNTLPEKGLHWYVALSRNRFFVRDLTLPAMPLEEALDAVRGMLPIVSHLPLDEIYWDVALARQPEKSLRALIVYGFRKEIEPIREIFRETGHEGGLVAVFPLGFGIGHYLKLRGYPLPMAVEIPYHDGVEVALYDAWGCKASFFAAQGGGSGGASLDALRAGLDVPVDRIYALGSEELERGLPQSSPRPFPAFVGLEDNLAAAALACGLSSMQIISIDPTPTRLKLFPFWKLTASVVTVMAIACAAWWVTAVRSVDANRLTLAQLKDAKTQLEQRLRPLERNRQITQTAQQLIDDMEEFAKTRPRVYRWINEIAELAPEGTWFSRFTLNEKEIVLQGQSRDAIKTLEALRAAAFLEQVKLTGSVMKAPNGLDQFNLNMKLKEEKAPAHEPSPSADQ